MNTLLSLIGVVLGLVGVLILAREVLLSHRAERSHWSLRKVSMDLDALVSDPLAQGKKDIEELMSKKETLTAWEKTALRLQSKLLNDKDISAEFIEEMRQQAISDRAAFREYYEKFDSVVTPSVLDKRQRMLYFGVVLIFVGGLLQAAGLILAM